ncbi:MAG: hypothetical protein KDD48_00290 [Bdellovibrionales bacterium]|nr:hypothetical protein [Bdellovibrionales bacterium]
MLYIISMSYPSYPKQNVLLVVASVSIMFLASSCGYQELISPAKITIARVTAKQTETTLTSLSLVDCLNHDITVPVGYKIVACIDMENVYYPFPGFNVADLDKSEKHKMIARATDGIVWESQAVQDISTNIPNLYASGWAKTFIPPDQTPPTYYFPPSTIGNSQNTRYFVWSFQDPTYPFDFSISAQGWYVIGLMNSNFRLVYQSPILPEVVFMFLQRVCSETHLNDWTNGLVQIRNDLATLDLAIYWFWLEHGYFQDDPFGHLSEEDRLHIESLLSDRNELITASSEIKDNLKECSSDVGSS